MTQQENFGYLPKEQRIPDNQYCDLLEKILTKGKKFQSQHHSEPSYKLAGEQMRFKRENGFTATPLRDLQKYNLIKGALGESIGFMHGARTLEQLEKYGCPKKFWAPWVTKEKCAVFGLEEGDLGEHSYGPAIAAFPKPDGTTFNQIESYERQLKKFPFKRTNRIDPWVPFGLTSGDRENNPRKTVVAPCHFWVTPHVYEDGTFQLEHNQRSADCPVGLQFNMMQYFAFGLYTERSTGYRFTELIYTISDAHIYESQVPFVEKMLALESRIYPELHFIDNAPTESILDFRIEHMYVKDYDPHPWMQIPTPI